MTLIYPSEFRTSNAANTGITTIVTGASSSSTIQENGSSHEKFGSTPRTTLSASLSYSQQVNPALQIMFLGDVVKQSGYLGLPFHRVYFNTGQDTIEHLPSSRFKLPLGFRANYFLTDNIILRAYYRYYTDNWGIRSNSAQLEVPYKITPFVSIAPFYRYYTQTASKYFAPYQMHNPTDEYYTSNYEYAKFNSSFLGLNFRVAPVHGVFGWQQLHDLEIRYGHYTQTTDLNSNIISFNFSFK